MRQAAGSSKNASLEIVEIVEGWRSVISTALPSYAPKVGWRALNGFSLAPANCKIVGAMWAFCNSTPPTKRLKYGETKRD